MTVVGKMCPKFVIVVKNVIYVPLEPFFLDVLVEKNPIKNADIVLSIALTIDNNINNDI